MDSDRSETTETAGVPGATLKTEVLAEVDELAQRLAKSVPGFDSFWLVGAGAIGEFELVETAIAWICESELAFVLVTDRAIPTATLRCLRAGIGLHLGGLRVRLRCFNKQWLRAHASKHREGYELFESRRLLAGDPEAVETLAMEWSTSGSAEAAENVLIDSLEPLLRSWPDRPMLEREPGAHPERSQLVLHGAWIELARAIGDALLILHGEFKSERLARAEAVAQRVDPQAREVFAWAYGEQPLLEALPYDGTRVWETLRSTMIDALSTAVAKRQDKQLDDPLALVAHVRSCRRSMSSRIKRFFKAQQRAGGREFAQLLLLLAIARPSEGEERRRLIQRSVRLLSLVGGPILANPDWERIRREALIVEPWQHLMPSRLLLGSRVAKLETVAATTQAAASDQAEEGSSETASADQRKPSTA